MATKGDKKLQDKSIYEEPKKKEELKTQSVNKTPNKKPVRDLGNVNGE